MKTIRLLQFTAVAALLLCAAPAHAQSAGDDWPSWIGRVDTTTYEFFSSHRSDSSSAPAVVNPPLAALEPTGEAPRMTRQQMYYYAINQVSTPYVPERFRTLHYDENGPVFTWELLPPTIVRTGSDDDMRWPLWIDKPHWLFR